MDIFSIKTEILMKRTENILLKDIQILFAGKCYKFGFKLQRNFIAECLQTINGNER